MNISKLILSISIILFPFSAHSQIQSSLPEDQAPFFIPTGIPAVINECPSSAIGNVTFEGFNDLLFNSFHYAAKWGRPNYNIGVLRATTAGWYHIYRMPNKIMADSGNHQRNETAFLSIPNGMNLGGKPHSSSGPHCNGWRLMMDIDNDGPPPYDETAEINYGGTFYLNAGDNIVSYNHFCKMQNMIGGCDTYEDLVPTDDSSIPLNGYISSCDYPQTADQISLPNANSIGINIKAICAIPDNSLPDPSNPSFVIPTPPVTPNILNGDFTSGALGLEPSDWVGIGEDGFGMQRAGFKIASIRDSSKFVVGDDEGNKVLHAIENGGFFATHYIPNKIDENWTDLSWRNYIYQGKFKFLESASRPRMFGLSVYSEFPYNPRAVALTVNAGGTAKLKVINYVPEYITHRDSSFDAGANIDTGVLPSGDSYYHFKISATTPLDGSDGADAGQTVVKAKVWVEGSAEPVDWQASGTINSRSGSGSGAVGVLGQGIQGNGVYIDDLAVTPIP